MSESFGYLFDGGAVAGRELEKVIALWQVGHIYLGFLRLYKMIGQQLAGSRKQLYVL